MEWRPLFFLLWCEISEWLKIASCVLLKHIFTFVLHCPLPFVVVQLPFPRVSAKLSTNLSFHFNLKRSWICFILPCKSSPDPRGYHIDYDQIPLNFVFSLSILYRNLQNGLLFFQNNPCALLLQKLRKPFGVQNSKVIWKWIQTIVCIEMKEICLLSSDQFRDTIGYQQK